MATARLEVLEISEGKVNRCAGEIGRVRKCSDKLWSSSPFRNVDRTAHFMGQNCGVSGFRCCHLVSQI